MATFNFETITAAQAQMFTVNDRLVFLTGTAVQSSVAYLANGDIAITSGGFSQEFNFSISFVQQPFPFHADGCVVDWQHGPRPGFLWRGGPSKRRVRRRQRRQS